MNELELDKFYFDEDSIKEGLQSLDLSCLSKGKNLRAKLLYQFGEFLKLEDKDLTKLGRIVEMVHNATLTHDDVIDNSHTRRNSPSIPNLINNKKSVLLGDYMLARSLFELSEFNNPALIKELTLTLKNLVEGEWIQYENTNPYATSLSIYETLSIKKTGALFRWCFLAPLLKAEKLESYDLMSEFGEKLGLIFQITDDIIDFNQNNQKSYGLDFQNNNLNFVLHFVGKNNPEVIQDFLKEENISNLSPESLKMIDDGVLLAKAELQKHTARLHEILNILNKNLIKDHSLFQDLNLLINLINTREY